MEIVIFKGFWTLDFGRCR